MENIILELENKGMTFQKGCSKQKEEIIRELNRENIFELSIDLSYFSCLRTRIYLVGIRNCVVHNNSLKIFKMYRYGYETRSKKEIHNFNKLMFYLLNKKWDPIN